MCLLLFIRIFAALMAKMRDGPQYMWVASCVSQTIFGMFAYNALTGPAARSADTSIPTEHISVSLPKLKVTLTLSRWVYTIQAFAASSHLTHINCSSRLHS